MMKGFWGGRRFAWGTGWTKFSGVLRRRLVSSLQGRLWWIYLCLRRTYVRRHVPTTEQFLKYKVHTIDFLSFFFEYKDLFMNRIYHFESDRSDPLILDCGSYIGMSILYFKHVHPCARVIGFEPDPVIFKVLQENVARNRLTNVTLVNAALGSHEGEMSFVTDGADGGRLTEYMSGVGIGQMASPVRVVCVSGYLTEPVDFLKMNIEGAEYDVLDEVGERLRLVRQMVVEYHSFERINQNLHHILALLAEHGFRYLINHFDYQTNPSVRPPFHLTPDSRYFLLIYARRSGSVLLE